MTDSEHLTVYSNRNNKRYRTTHGHARSVAANPPNLTTLRRDNVKISMQIFLISVSKFRRHRSYGKFPFSKVKIANSLDND